MPKAQRKLLLKYSENRAGGSGHSSRQHSAASAQSDFASAEVSLGGDRFLHAHQGLTAGEGGRLAWGIADGSMSVEKSQKP